MKIRKREKRGFKWIYVLLYLTGATLFVLSHWIRVTTAVGLQHHPIEFWSRVAHVTMSYIGVLALGFLVKAHVMPGLKGKLKTKSGLTVLAVLLTMIGTAVGVLYGSGEAEELSLVAWVHALLGLSTPVFIAVHLLTRMPERPKR